MATLNTAVQHFPEKPNGKRHRCQLHRWARDRRGKEVFATVTTCSVCRVNLCLSCYKLFHTEANICIRKAALQVREGVESGRVKRLPSSFF